MLQELIQKLQNDHGLTAEQSHGILSTVTGYIKEKFPMLKGAVESIFSEKGAAQEAGQATTKINDTATAPGQKTEGFANEFAHKAEEVFDNVKGKLSGLFNGSKE